MEKKNHTRLTVKRSNTEVEKKYLVEETHVLYHCSSSESKKRIQEEEEMSRERKGKRETERNIRERDRARHREGESLWEREGEMER